MSGDRATRSAALLAATLSLLLLGGCCGGPRVATEPLTSLELETLAAAVDTTVQHLTVLRGSGNGMLSTDEQRSPFAFAVVYDHPGWLRADLRPSSPAAPSGFAAYLRISGECADLLFPSSLIMVTDCLEEPPFADPSLLFFGVLSGDDVRALEEPHVSRDGDIIRLTGRRGRLRVEIDFEGHTNALTRIEVRDDDASWLTVDYDGHGWKDSLPLPSTTAVRFGRKGRTRAKLQFDFDRLRATDAIDRSALDLVVPPGTTVSTWGDLALWR